MTKKKDCGECARRELLDALDEARTYVPEPIDTGFGAHDGYVCGLLSGILCHIEAVKVELMQVERDSMQDGSFLEKKGD